MATPRPRFRIDPRDAPVEPQREPDAAPVRPRSAPIAPSPPIAPPALPLAPPLAPRSPSRKRWVWVAVAIVGILVIAGTATYALTSTSLAYPKKYLLMEEDAPRGLRLSDPSNSGSVGEWIEDGQNPGRFTPAGLDELQSRLGLRPAEAWGEAFNTPSVRGGPITVVAMKFGSEEEATSALRALRLACTPGSTRTTLMQDGAIIVLVDARSTGEPVAYQGRVVTALQAKASGLKLICTS